jgi:hypothetical protein
VIFAAILAAAAVFLGWLGWTTPDPTRGGLFLVGAAVAAGCAVLWFLDVRKLRRSTR